MNNSIKSKQAIEDCLFHEDYKVAKFMCSNVGCKTTWVIKIGSLEISRHNSRIVHLNSKIKKFNYIDNIINSFALTYEMYD